MAPTMIGNPQLILNLIFATLALLSLALTLWQWVVARRFPLHQRVSAPLSSAALGSSRREEALASAPRPSPLAPQLAISLLKPLKGCDPATEDCLRSWFTQQYPGPVQILFGVAAADDPVCEVVRKILQEFPGADAQLVAGNAVPGANAKVAKLAELERLAKHDLLVSSDADVRVPPRPPGQHRRPSVRGSPLPLGGGEGKGEGPSLDLRFHGEGVVCRAKFIGASTTVPARIETMNPSEKTDPSPRPLPFGREEGEIVGSAPGMGGSGEGLAVCVLFLSPGQPHHAGDAVGGHSRLTPISGARSCKLGA